MLLFLSMTGHVILEKLFLAQFLTTERAHDWATTDGPLGPIMDHQLLPIYKFTAIEGTFQGCLLWVLVVYMVGESSLLCELFPAQAAAVWLLTSVGLNVPLQVVKSGKYLMTYVTLIWLLPRVGTHMSGQIALLSKFLSTDRTLVWLLPQVDQHVGPKRCAVSK